MKATEREAVVAVVAKRWLNSVAIEVEVECVGSRVRVLRPVDTGVAGATQAAVVVGNDSSATDKEQSPEPQRANNLYSLFGALLVILFVFCLSFFV